MEEKLEKTYQVRITETLHGRIINRSLYERQYLAYKIRELLENLCSGSQTEKLRQALFSKKI